MVRYEAEKSKAGNLQLQKENTQQQVIFWSAIALFIAVANIARIRYRKRRQQMELASRLAIQANQLKTSQKVHDVVANRLYRLMTEIEHSDIIDKEVLLDKIEELYNRSRDISYEPSEPVHHNFQHTISELTTSFSSPSTKVYVTGNNQSYWNRISTKAQLEIEQVLQELLINMKKHSGAQNVVLKFDREEHTIRIQYTDDGVGLPSPFKSGNGLTNTGNRIKSIGGTLTFEETMKGLKILISIPTASTI